jgi:hypothetical protein
VPTNDNGNLLPCIYIIGSAGSEKYVLRAVGDGQVKIDANDVPDYLIDKLLPGSNITFGISAGPNKTITINSVGGSGSGTTLIGANAYTCTPSLCGWTTRI